MTRLFPTLGDLGSEAALDAIARERLPHTLASAERAPFYATRGNLAQGKPFEDIPFLTKDDLREAYPFGLLAVPRTEIASYHESTGTSGDPTSSYFTESDWDDVATRFLRSAARVCPEDTVLIKTPYAMVTTAHQMHRAARLSGAMVVPADNRTGNMSYPRVVRLLQDLAITVTWSMPTEALLWAAAAWHAGKDPQNDFPGLRALMVAGEPMSTERRQRIGEIWGRARVYEDYGSTETGSLAGQCEAGALHLWADRFHFEVLDAETQRTSSEGRGELVVTSLFREGMPLVRYRLGDVVELEKSECPCGWNLPTVKVKGRAGAAFRVRGREVYPADLEAAVFSLPIERRVLFWRARCEQERVVVEIEVSESQREAACRELEALLSARTGLRACISPVAVGAIVPESLLRSSSTFRKPRFVFGPDEDWSTAVAY